MYQATPSTTATYIITTIVCKSQCRRELFKWKERDRLGSRLERSKGISFLERERGGGGEKEV